MMTRLRGPVVSGSIQGRECRGGRRPLQPQHGSSTTFKIRPIPVERSAWRRASIKKSRIPSTDSWLNYDSTDLFPWQPHYVAQLTRYITLLFNRSRNRRNATRENTQIQVESLQSLLANDHQISQIAARWTIGQIGIGISPEEATVTADEVRERLNETIERIQTEEHIQTTYVDAMERALASFDQTIAGGRWGILSTTPDNPFIIGDAPVVTWIRGGNFLHYGFGFQRPNVEVLLPVCPTACLHVLPAVPRNQQLLTPTVSEVNEAQASFASEYCYAHTNSPVLNDLIQCRIGRRRIGVYLFSVRHRNYSNTMFELLMSGGSRFRAPRR